MPRDDYQPVDLQHWRRQTAFWFPLAGACVAVGFIGINLVWGRYELLPVDAATLLVLVAALVLSQYVEDPELPLLTSIVAVGVALVGLSATQGILGYFWIFIVPILSFFAIGMRAGLVLNGVTLVVLAVVVSIWTPTEVPQPISPTILISFALVTGFAAVYRFIHDAQQARLQELTMTDQLTGLGNRRRLETVLDREVAKVERYGGTLSLVLMDLDDFKQVNDEHGHQAGDHLLVDFSDVLARNVRDTDTVIRYGGDEFVVVAPDPETESEEGQRESAEAIAARIAEVIDTHEFSVGDVSASMGIAQFREGDSVEDLLKRADGRLYAAKEREVRAVVEE